jgi:hypothetical protein
MTDEKDEKFDEKALEKQEEKSYEEKSWDEKYRRDPLGLVVWALIFIWAGVVLLASNLGVLDNIINRSMIIPDVEELSAVLSSWSIILIGAGVIFLMEAAIRMLLPEYRKPVTGTIIFAIILIGVGLGDLISWNIIWPIVLIVLGLSMILRVFLHKDDEMKE